MATTKEGGTQRIDAYLARLRTRLFGFNELEVDEIVKELRSHIEDKIAGNGTETVPGVDRVLATLGSPEALANEYITDNLLARAVASRSPLRILESLFRLASLSVAGFFVLFGSVMGYFLGAVLILVALLKPFHPQTAGLWVLRDSAGDAEISLRLGFGSVLVGGKEVLGWWIIPIGLLAGCAVVVLTTRFSVWCARQYRKSRPLPRS
jgi:hypothetical protein